MIAAIEEGCHKRGDIKRITGLDYMVLNYQLTELHMQGLIISCDEGAFEMYYTPEQHKQKLDSKVTHIDPSQFGTVVSDGRLSHAIETVKEEKNITPKKITGKSLDKVVREIENPLTKEDYDILGCDPPTNFPEKSEDVTVNSLPIQTLSLPLASKETDEQDTQPTSTALEVVRAETTAIDVTSDFLEKVSDARVWLDEKHRRDMAAIERTIEIIQEMENAA